jgi:hypothetical protein
MKHGTQDPADIAASFIGLVGAKPWAARVAELGRQCADGQRTSRATLQRHAILVTIERLRRGGRNAPLTRLEQSVADLAHEVCAAADALGGAGRDRLRAAARAGLQPDATLVPLFHLARAARLQRERGFEVAYAGFAEAAPFDLLLSRGNVDAELACDVVSAEEGRDLHRGAWVRLVDRVDPDLQTWLAAHPGRYLLKMTLPQGLRSGPDHQDRLANLHTRIRTMLEGQRRADYDEAAVLRLDPLMLAGSQADELGLMGNLRREFGHEAHLAVTGGEGSVFVMAARAGREDSVAVAIRERMGAVAPTRLTGTRPGILAMLIDDTDRVEWRHLRDRLILEGEARQFLTRPEARGIVAVTCASRLELLDDGGSDMVADGELRYRNPAHPQAKAAALAPAVLSSM